MNNIRHPLLTSPINSPSLIPCSYRVGRVMIVAFVWPRQSKYFHYRDDGANWATPLSLMRVLECFAGTGKRHSVHSLPTWQRANTMIVLPRPTQA